MQVDIIGIMIFDPSGRIIDANDTFLRFGGYTYGDLKGGKLNWLKLTPPEWMTVSLEERRKLERTGRIGPYEKECFRKDGSRWWGLFAGASIGDGLTREYVIDITDRKKAEEALRRSEARFREAFDHAPIGMTLNDLEGRFIHVNDAYCRMVGYSREELLGTDFDFMKLTHPQDIGYNLDEFRQLLAGEIPAFFVEKRYFRKDGKSIWVRASATLQRDDAGNPLHIVGLIEDITRRKEAEEQLLQALKMEAIGRLAGGVAHEFNNMLNVILGYAEILGSRLTRESPLYQYVREIVMAARRSADMTGKLLAYSRKQIVQPKVIDLNQVIHAQKLMLNRLIGEAIGFRFQPGARLWPVRIDPAQVDQILANLSVNSRDAIPSTGMVTIRTENLRIDDSSAPPDLSAGDYVRLTFSDTGIGMDEVTREKIFEPYFTTKDVGKGTGLGLATVYGIVKQNGGEIQVRSQPGKGTTFHLYFPRSVDEAEGAATEPESDLSKGAETVLIVEDEKQVLKLTKMILEDAGYHVLAASTPGEALDIARQNKEKIDLLISDVIMPEMNGKTLASKISAITPGFRTIFMSGYTDDVIAGKDIPDRDVDFIRKPFTSRSLTQKVRETLDR